jgi:PAS domain S-box-containing protein
MAGESSKESQIFEAISEVFRGVISLEASDVFAKICLDQAKALTQSQIGWVGKVNSHGLMDTIAMDDPGWDACRIPETKAARSINNMALRGIWSRVIESGEPLICNDPQHHPDSVGVPEGHPELSCFLGVPLKIGEKTIGMISLANKPGGYDETDVAAVEKLSVVVVEALHRKEVDDLQTMVKDIAAWLSVCPDLETAQTDVIEQVLLLEGIHCCALFRVHKHEPFELIAYQSTTNCMNGKPEHLFAKTALIDELFLGHSIIARTSQIPDFVEVCCIMDEVKATAFLPLIYGDNVEAVLVVASMSETTIPKHIRDTLESIASLTGAAFARLGAKAALEENQARFQALFEESPVPICEVDLSLLKAHFDEIRSTHAPNLGDYFQRHPEAVRQAYGRISIEDCNAAAIALFDAQSKTELCGYFEHTFSERSFPAFLEMAVGLEAGQCPQTYEAVAHSLTGRTIYTQSQWSVVRGHEVDLSKVIFSSVDVSARRLAEEASWRANAYLEQLFDSAADGLCVIDCAYSITRVNKQFPFLGNRTKDEIVGMHCREAMCLPCCGTDVCHMKRIMAGENHVDQDVVIEKDGAKQFYIISSSPLKDSEGEVMAMISFIKDISDRKRMEQQMMQSQKLESIGQLAAGIAHEINTPIQYLGDNLHFLEESFADMNSILDIVANPETISAQETTMEKWAKQIEAHIEEIDLHFLKEEVPNAIRQSLEGVGRVAEIVQAMKAFSHPGTEQKTPTDINAALRTTVTVARNEWKYTADVETDLDDRLPNIPCLPGELNQVFLNIIVNSSHAIAEKSAGRDERGKIRIVTTFDDKWVEVRISDTGSGIPEQIKSRIFDPFFTTKEVGKGTGQGLAMAYVTINEKHSGEILVDSEVGKGTTFTIRLPIDSAQRPHLKST